MRDSVAIRTPQPTIAGVAVRYDVDTSVQYLGTVAVLGAMQTWSPVQLSIYSDEGGQPGEKLHTQLLKAPSYTYHNRGTLEGASRNLSDAFQTFFALDRSEPLMLPAGTFYIAFESADGSALPTPLLLSKARTHTTPYAWHSVGGAWQPASLSGQPYLGHYWLDPIVLGNIKGSGTNQFPTPESPQAFIAGKLLYLLLPPSWLTEGEPLQLELYSSAGLRLLTRPMTTSSTSIALDDYPLSSGVYIVHLTRGKARYSSKVYYQP